MPSDLLLLSQTPANFLLLSLHIFFQSLLGLVFQSFNLFPQYTVLQNMTLAPALAEKETEAAELQERIAAVEAAVAGNGRLLIRPSGTEPLVRVMMEGSDIEQIRPLAENLAALIQNKFSQAAE